MTDYQVLIPEDSYVLINVTYEGMPAVVVVNSALLGFEPKVIFHYHLSIIIDFVDLIDNGMPSAAERSVVDPFVDKLDRDVRGNSEKPNALFLARRTWNGTRQVLYRVHDPGVVHAYLQRVIELKAHPREFDYRLDPDPKWELSSWYLEAVDNNRTSL